MPIIDKQELTENSNTESLDKLMEKPSEELSEKLSEKFYYEQSLKDGYRGLMGAIIGTFIAEFVLWVGGLRLNLELVSQGSTNYSLPIMENIPLIFIAIGFMFSIRHVLQIWQAKTQLKELSLDN
jgi:hypothetical protein